MKKSIFLKSLVTIIIAIVFIGCNNNSKPHNNVKNNQEIKTTVKDTVAESQVVSQPLNIENSFIPCGWMGDGEMGKKHIDFEPKCTENPHSGTTCIKISYKTGPNGWAGIYWLNNDCNWGDEIGYDLSTKGYSKITFWGRGAQGGESAQFKAGGVKDKQYKDSFNCEPKLDISFENEWMEYTIDLRGKKLSNVIGGFCWVSNSDVTFYLDDLKYE